MRPGKNTFVCLTLFISLHVLMETTVTATTGSTAGGSITGTHTTGSTTETQTTGSTTETPTSGSPTEIPTSISTTGTQTTGSTTGTQTTGSTTETPTSSSTTETQTSSSPTETQTSSSTTGTETTGYTTGTQTTGSTTGTQSTGSTTETPTSRSTTGTQTTGSSTGTQTTGSTSETQTTGSTTDTPTSGSTTGTQSSSSTTGTQTTGSTTGTQSSSSTTGIQTTGSTTGTQSTGSTTKTQLSSSTTGTQSTGSTTETQTTGSTTETQTTGTTTRTQTSSSTTGTQTTGSTSETQTTGSTPDTPTSGSTTGTQSSSSTTGTQTTGYTTGTQTTGSTTGTQSTGSTTETPTSRSTTGTQTTGSSTGTQTTGSTSETQTTGSTTDTPTSGSTTGTQSSSSTTGTQTTGSTTGTQSTGSTTGTQSTVSTTKTQTSSSPTETQTSSSTTGTLTTGSTSETQTTGSTPDTPTSGSTTGTQSSSSTTGTQTTGSTTGTQSTGSTTKTQTSSATTGTQSTGSTTGTQTTGSTTETQTTGSTTETQTTGTTTRTQSSSSTTGTQSTGSTTETQTSGSKTDYTSTTNTITTTKFPECTIYNSTSMTQFPLQLAEKEIASFRCEFYTNSACRNDAIIWKHKGKKIGNGAPNYNISHRKENDYIISNLTIQSLQRSDRGHLSCEIHDRLVEKILAITVELPVIHISPVKASVESGQRTTITCNITNYINIDHSNISFTWCQNNTKWTEHIDNSSSSHSVLTPEMQYNGNYSCDVGVNVSCPTKHVSEIDVFQKGSTTCSKDGDWNVTRSNFTAIKPCPIPFTGNIERYCTPSGEWGNPDMNNCIREEFNEVLNDLNKVADEDLVEVVDKAVSKITNVTASNSETKLSSGELRETSKILDTITDLFTNSSSSVPVNSGTAKNFFVVLDQILSPDNSATWKDVKPDENEKQTGVTDLMKTVENFGKVFANTLNNESTNIRFSEMSNIVIEIGKAKNNAIHFTANGSTSGEGHLQIQLKDFENEPTHQPFVAAVYRTIADAIPESEGNISEVLSLSLPGNNDTKINLKNPVNLTFNANQNDDLKCVYWDFDNSSWSQVGCNRTGTVCTCYHLTNFAILMSPFPATEAYVLRIISFIGCIMSALSTLVTMAVYFKLWRYVKSDRNRLLMNLCAALTVAYLLFLGGINSTHDDILCTTIAALLHYFFLATFCLMLAEGIEILISVTYVFHTKSKLTWFLLLGWGAPAVVVAVTVGITHDDEYISDSFCWLTFTNGVIYSFIGPVGCIIVVNLIVLAIVMKALYSSQLIQTKTEKQKVLAGVRSVSVLLPVLGITWLFGIVSISDDLIVFQYLFAVTNSLQGFFIFLFYCVFNVPIRQALTRSRKHFDSLRTQSLRTGEENSEVAMKSWNNSQDYSDKPDKITSYTEFKLPRPDFKLLENTTPFFSPKRFPSFSSTNDYDTTM